MEDLEQLFFDALFPNQPALTAPSSGKWTREEEAALHKGIAKHGLGKWTAILRDPALCPAFHAQRTAQHLKDKWRNLSSPRRARERMIRRFTLLHSDHSLRLGANQRPHIYNNRLPRDAALKAATKDEFYPGIGAEMGSVSSVVWVMEYCCESGHGLEEAEKIVHVFEISRRRVVVPSGVKKFDKSGQRALWVPSVVKLRTERYRGGGGGGGE